jgi:hypothetical protein
MRLNTFEEEGARSTESGVSANKNAIGIVWFSYIYIHTQAAHKESTPVIQRLIGAGVPGSGNNTAVLLFCRCIGLPYVYCGSLQYMLHSTKTSPLQIIWKLSDTTLLEQSPDFAQLLVGK